MSHPRGRKRAWKGLWNLGNSFVPGTSRATRKMSKEKEMPALSELKRWVSTYQNLLVLQSNYILNEHTPFPLCFSMNDSGIFFQEYTESATAGN